MTWIGIEDYYGCLIESIEQSGYRRIRDGRWVSLAGIRFTGAFLTKATFSFGIW